MTSCGRRLAVFPTWDNEDRITVYLEVEDPETQPSRWSIDAKFILSVINQFNENLTKSKEQQYRFSDCGRQSCGFGHLIALSELLDPKGGYLVDDTCIIEAKVSVRGANNTSKEHEVTLQPDVIPNVENHHGVPLLCRANYSRTSSIAPPPTDLTKPSSILKNRSYVARDILQGFLSEFVEDFPTYEKFGLVMEDLRATMYGGKMGDIFDEWRPSILEIESLLEDIEDKEHQSPLSKLEESLNDIWSQLDSRRKELQSTLEKWKELKSAQIKAAREMLTALKEIKKLNQREEDVITEIEDVIAGEGEGAIAEKKDKIVEWLSNPFPPQNS